MARGSQGSTQSSENRRLKHGGRERTVDQTRDGNGGNGELGNRKAEEEGRLTWSNLLFRLQSVVQKAPAKLGAEQGSRFPLDWFGWGRTPHPSDTSPASSDSHFGWGTGRGCSSLRSEPHPAEEQGRGK